MYDPMSVAHEIKWPFKNKRGYRDSIITIWHVDPEKRNSNRRDDSCGWFAPPISEEEREIVEKLAKDQYDSIFARKMAIENDKDYYTVCYDQDCFGALYWVWRALKSKFKPKVPWQYGVELSNKELQYIIQLATNPVDNFQSHMKGMMKPNPEGLNNFKEFVSLVFRSFRRYYRPWYKHPRWHIHHWRIQFRPWQRFKRRWWDKCCKCGKRGFKGNAYGDWNGTRIWHDHCDDSAKAPKPVEESENLSNVTVYNDGKIQERNTQVGRDGNLDQGGKSPEA